jgi:vitamin B12 transporter
MHRTISTTLLALAACAAEESPTIIVSADRSESELARLPVAADLVRLDEVAERGGEINPADWLRGLPGVGVWSTGGGIDGGTQTVRLRGLSGKYTLFLVDGIPATDQSKDDGQLRLPLLAPAGIESVEVVRGSQSGLYGSGAVGGVVDFRTARPTADHRLRVSASAGSFDAYAGEAVATGPLGSATGYALSLAGLDARGFSAVTTKADGDPDGFEDDGVQRLAGRLRLEHRLADGLVAYAAVAGGRTRQDYDSSGADDAVSDGVFRQRQASAGAAWRGAAGEAAVDLSRNASSYLSSDAWYGASSYDAVGWYGSARGLARVAGGLRLGGGADARIDQAEAVSGGSSQFDRRMDQQGAWLQAVWSDARWEASAIGRLDRHSDFGTHPTARLAAACFVVPEALKLRAAAGTGFLAPSLYQLHVDVPAWTLKGNPDLDAESSRSGEVGADWMPAIGVRLSATAFRVEVEDQITYRSASPNYINDVGTSVSRGLELAGDVEHCLDAVHVVAVEASYTYLDAEDAQGRPAPFAPRHAGSTRLRLEQHLGGDWRCWQGVGARRGTSHYANTGGADRVDVPTLAEAVVGVSWRGRWDATLRADNLADEAYTQNSSFGTTYAGSPRSYWLTVTGRF